MSLLTSSCLLLLLAGTALASPVRRDCTQSWPSYPDTDTLNTIYAICVQRNVNDKVLLATFETAWVETRVWPLDCGDQDSVGVFQQRPSQGWGTVEQCSDTVYATNKFLDQAIWNDSQSPNMTAGQLAQSVQISDYPLRYQENEAMGIQLVALARANAAAMSSSSSSSSSSSTTGTTTTTSATSTGTSQTTTSSSTSQSTASSSTSQSTTSSSSVPTNARTSTTSTSSPTTSKPASTSTPAKAIATPISKVPSPLTSGTITKGCDTYAKGSTCSAVQKQYSVSLAQLRFWNPKLNSSCSNMSKSTYYCVKSKTVAPPSNVTSGTIKTGCKTYAVVKSGMTCSTLTSKNKITISQLRSWNTAVNSKCTNLQANKSYCVSAI